MLNQGNSAAIMIAKHPYKAYANATQTVARTRQIVMLYDGAIRFLKQAQDVNKTRQIEERFNLLVKTSDIINGLQSCLDFEQGGEIARTLYAFYASVDSRIFSLHRHSSEKNYEQIIQDLKQMRDVWVNIDHQESGDATPTTSAASKPDASPQPSITTADNVILSA